MADKRSKPVYAADTVALLFRLEGRRLGADAANAFQSVEQNQALLYIPVFVFAEIMYLFEKHRTQISVADATGYINQYAESVRAAPLDPQVILEAQQITDVPELHDRLIAATARVYGAVLITSDHTLQASQFVQTVW